MRERYWTYERVKKEAQKYETRTLFAQKGGGAYYAALRDKFLEDVCQHMWSPYKPRGYWTRARVEKEARKYKTRGAFYDGSKSAYSAAYRGGYLDEICKHMRYCYAH